MDNLKRNNMVIVILLLAFIIVMIALTLSIFAYAKPGTTSNKITFGKLELTLTEGNEINLTEAYPMTDTEGKNSTGFSFTLKNTGTAATNYKIYLDDVSVGSSYTRLDDKYIKCSLTKNSTVGDAKFISSFGTSPNRALDSGVISKGASNTYNLKIWVTSTVDGDIGGQAFKAKLRIEGEQVK